MDDAKQQLLDRLQSANNILVTVSRNPSVDQLASCIGLTLLLNKQGKHAAAVFSGKVPSTLEFLKPDETIEKNTDSLRDFIISLDKSKADKLRYKVEEDVVRIFITPYKTSLSADDLEFSEGDFNVDVVVALGVKKQEDLDEAITAHGRILHDATVTSINTDGDGGLGSINWNDPQASSLSELITELADVLDGELVDSQIATALLTGIVSETGRFSNDRTSSQTMSASAFLLSAGANQQLVASKLESKSDAASSDDAGAGDEGTHEEDGSGGVLDIDHSADSQAPQAEELTPEVPLEQPEPPAPQPPAPEPPQPGPGDQPAPPAPEPPSTGLTHGAKLVTEPPQLGGTLTANSESERLDPVTDPLSLPQSEPPVMFDSPKAESVGQPSAPAPASDQPEPLSTQPPAPQPPAPEPQQPGPGAQPPAGQPDDKKTLSEIEKSVDSPHLAADIESVRGEVDKALAGTASNEPIEALNAQPMGGELHMPQPPAPDSDQPEPPAPQPAAPEPPQPAADQGQGAPAQATDSQDSDKSGPNAPPPVPPPIPFQFGNSAPPKP